MILLKMFLLCEEVISILRNTAYCYFVKVPKVYQSISPILSVQNVPVVVESTCSEWLIIFFYNIIVIIITCITCLNVAGQRNKKWKSLYFVLNASEQQLYYFDNQKVKMQQFLVWIDNSASQYMLLYVKLYVIAVKFNGVL